MRPRQFLTFSFFFFLASLQLVAAIDILPPFNNTQPTGNPDASGGQQPPAGQNTPPGQNTTSPTPDPNPNPNPSGGSSVGNSLPPTPSQSPPPTPTPSLTLSTSLSTDPGGLVVTEIQTQTLSANDTAPTNTNDNKQADNNNNSSSSGGFGTGSIIGLSVAGGIAVLGVVGFLIWKLTRKRFSDFDDNEAIKWPELNAHTGGGGLESHPLPTNNTGRSGFDTGSEVSLDRTAAYSTSDLASTHDPYAVPPLPHNNPNQPYRDDPNALSGYYDPYRGPVPNTFQEPETIPMTQLNNGRMSPAPGVAYGPGVGVGPGMAGRASPAPSASLAAYGGRSSPGPHLAYGRSSPGPQAAYDMQGGQR